MHNIHLYFNGRLRLELKLELDPPAAETMLPSRERLADFKLWRGG